jgi:4-oxalocrotonate tautomerase
MSLSNSGQGNPNSKRPDAEKIVKDVTTILNYGEESVSVAFEEVEPQDWAARVYQPDIIRNSDRLYKKPGYTM